MFKLSPDGIDNFIAKIGLRQVGASIDADQGAPRPRKNAKGFSRRSRACDL